MGFYATDTLEAAPPRSASARRACGGEAPERRRARRDPACSRKPLRGPTRGAISGFRFYSPEMGRWISRDPRGELAFLALQLAQASRTLAGDPSVFTHGQLSGRFLHGAISGMVAPAVAESYLFVKNMPSQKQDYLGLDITCTHNYDCKCPPGSNLGKKQKKDKVTDGCSFLGIDNPSGIPGCSFLDACDGHDCCYGTCGSSKLACDAQFCQAMNAKCWSCAWWNATLLLHCLHKAQIYCTGVALFGWGPHSNNQTEHCEDCCCTPSSTPPPTFPPPYSGGPGNQPPPVLIL